MADHLVGIDLIIGNLNPRTGQAAALAQKRAVALGLCPVQRVEVCREQLGGRGGCFDLVDRKAAVLFGDHAVGAALQGIAHAIYGALCFEGYLRLIGVARRLLQFAVNAAALVHAVEAGKAAVDAAATQHKLYQLAHRKADLQRLFHGVSFRGK